MKRIGIILYDGVSELGFVGPLQAFTAANDSAPRYEIVTVGLTSASCATESGLLLQAQQTAATAPALDTLIVPGGSGLRRAEVSAPMATWIADCEPTTRRIVSICTGIYGVAPTGLLNQRRVTTHWRCVRDVARRFPEVNVEENALFLQDGKFFTSAGGTAGIDLSLALIAQDFGSELALKIARELLVYLRRDGGQDQYAEPITLFTDVDGELGVLAGWIENHLGEDLRLDRLARQVGLGKVQFNRLFKSAFGVTAGVFIKTRRLNEARRRLLEGENTAKVARAVGFRSPLYFAQEFKWRFGTGPDEYQHRFRITAKPKALIAAQSDGAKISVAQQVQLRGRRWDRRRVLRAA